MLAFIHIHKTAGQTFEKILSSSFGPDHCYVQPWELPTGEIPFMSQDLKRVLRFYPNLQSFGGHHVHPYNDLDQEFDIRYVTFIREPIRRTISNYQYAVQVLKKNFTFKEWINNDWHHNRHTKMLAGEESLEKAIRIIQEKKVFMGITEYFDESLVLIKSLIDNRLNIAYQRVNVATQNKLASRLLEDPYTQQLIEDVNQLDIKLYDYVLKEKYPLYKREYGVSFEEDIKYYKGIHGSFSRRNVSLSLMKRYLLYKPFLFMYRKGIEI